MSFVSNYEVPSSQKEVDVRITNPAQFEKELRDLKWGKRLKGKGTCGKGAGKYPVRKTRDPQKKELRVHRNCWRSASWGMF